MRRIVGIGLVAAAGCLLAAAPPARWQWRLPAGVTPPPVPADNPMSAAKVALGRRLFYDADLSLDGTLSCASCHVQRHGFADSVAVRGGVRGAAGRRNAPGLANVGWLTPLTFADASADTLEAQAAIPIFGTHPVEMGMAGHEADIAARLGKGSCYRTMFGKAFPERAGAIAYADVARALAAFQRSMTAFGSAYDRGKLGAAAQRGKAVFDRDCATCHSGPHLTDLKAHRLEPADPNAPDQGLFETSGREEDRGRFRTPSLRNVALTGPWWHDGSAPSLDAAIARHGIATDAAALIPFLEALSDLEFTERPSLAMPATACGRRL